MKQLTSRDVDVRVEPPVEGVVIVRVAGEVDLAAAPALRHCVDERDPGLRVLVLDLSGVRFFGAAGLSALVHIRGVAERLALRWAVVAPDVVSRPLRITGLDVGLPVCSTLVEALARVTHVASDIPGQPPCRER
ncbi:STAS domain-containing protein [Saccharomonospora saliphila]|uniref:STAS domain-containing protein n=1 Tax=Saccharomonospora saliphila TaxID=369829 RepID=UPI0003757CA8|nr:STAS domain-containing protein [Saccharomonospora saliphila]